MKREWQSRQPSDTSDPLVSDEYHKTAMERPPSALDDKMLARARAEVADTGLRTFTVFWFRPVAFVAMLGLALALVLELTRTVDIESPMDAENGAGRRNGQLLEVRQPIQEPVERISPATQDGRSADAPAPPLVPRRDEHLPSRGAGAGPTVESANAPVVNDRPSADFAEANGAAAQRSGQAATKGAIRSVEYPAEPRAAAVARFQAAGIAADAPDRYCTDVQLAEAPGWWECIAELREAGRHHEANLELELFRQAHPGFEPPENHPAE